MYIIVNYSSFTFQVPDDNLLSRHLYLPLPVIHIVYFLPEVECLAVGWVGVVCVLPSYWVGTFLPGREKWWKSVQSCVLGTLCIKPGATLQKPLLLIKYLTN